MWLKYVVRVLGPKKGENKVKRCGRGGFSVNL